MGCNPTVDDGNLTLSAESCGSAALPPLPQSTSRGRHTRSEVWTRYAFTLGVTGVAAVVHLLFAARQWAPYECALKGDNPILKGLRWLRVFEDESVRTYTQAEGIIGVSRERVYRLLWEERIKRSPLCAPANSTAARFLFHESNP